MPNLSKVLGRVCFLERQADTGTFLLLAHFAQPCSRCCAKIVFANNAVHVYILKHRCVMLRVLQHQQDKYIVTKYSPT